MNSFQAKAPVGFFSFDLSKGTVSRGIISKMHLSYQKW